MTSVTQTKNYVVLDAGRMGVVQLSHIQIKPAMPPMIAAIAGDKLPVFDMVMIKQDGNMIAVPVDSVDDLIQALQIAKNKPPVDPNGMVQDGGDQDDL